MTTRCQVYGCLIRRGDCLPAVITFDTADAVADVVTTPRSLLLVTSPTYMTTTMMLDASC